MKVLCIVGYDDTTTGEVSGVVKMNDGDDEDQVFIKWYRHHHVKYLNITDKQILNSTYAWNVYEVQEL